MAKWGEGDPRWIVEERADATNVNNWHWSEKNATPWSKERLKELLENQVLEEGPIVVTLNSLKKCEGEATANNRKAKLIFLFEWDIKLDFTARVSGTEQEYKGNIEIPNLSDENEAHEVDVNASIDTKGPHETQIRQFFTNAGSKEKLATYLTELKTEFSKGLILPTDKVKPQVVTKGKTTTSVDKQNFQNAVVTEKKNSDGKELFSTKSVSASESYKVPPGRLFEVLKETNLVRAWCNGNVQWEFREEGAFTLFGGNVSGTFLSIEPDKKITMKWRLKNYPLDHYAELEFNLKDQGDSTLFEVIANDVPVHLAEETQTGLERYYVAAIGRTFGFSSKII